MASTYSVPTVGQRRRRRDWGRAGVYVAILGFLAIAWGVAFPYAFEAIR